MTEQRLCLLIGDAEVMPVGGGVCEAGGRRLVLATRLGNQGVRRGKRVSADWLIRVDPISQVGRERCVSPATSAERIASGISSLASCD